MPTSPKKQNNTLNEYLILFLALQAINMILSIFGLVMNFSTYKLIFAAGQALLASMFIIMTAIDILLNALVLIFFYIRKKIFIQIYIASAIFKILSAILTLTVFSSIITTGGFFNITMTIFGIILNAIMLYFWLNYFKTSVQLKTYLKRSRKKPVSRRNFRVVK